MPLCLIIRRILIKNIMKIVTIHDMKTKVYTDIPAAELAPGMVEVQIEGGRRAWVDASQIKMNNEFKHPPFEGKLRDDIIFIQKICSDFYGDSYKFWEDGFRKDQTPEKEIAIWMNIAKTFKKFGKIKSKITRKEVFRLLSTCCNSDPALLEMVFESTVLSEKAVRLISTYYYKL